MRPDDEADIRGLLSSIRPSQMTPGEHERILARIQRAPNTSMGPTSDDSDEPRQPAGTDSMSLVDQPRSRRPMAVVAAAAAGLVVALCAGLLLRSAPESEPVSTAPAALVECPTSWRTDHLDPLATALERWRTIENWAFTQGEPDLAGLVDAALVAASSFADQSAAAVARNAHDDLTATLSNVDETSILDSDTAAATRTDAVARAIDSVNEIGQSFDRRCEFRPIVLDP